MKNRKETIRRIVSYLNNPQEDGGFWLPNIQRPFVWRSDQICRLFDSILRMYPISTLLVWKTNSAIRRREFIDNWRADLRLSDFYVREEHTRKCLVLDGQQRLQSLFIALKGSYEGKELYFDLLSGEVSHPDDVKYKFMFLRREEAEYPWVRLKDIVYTDKREHQLAREIERRAAAPVSDADGGKIRDHLELVRRTIISNEAIAYQELDSIDDPSLYSEEDVVEVFIRANSGGTRLGKSDLLFSLLNASWEVADEQMEELLESLNRHGFKFTRDFVLKTCLVLFDRGARYKVEKFRKPGVRERIEAEWTSVAESIKDVLDYVRGETYIQCGKALPSYLVLIPLVYLRFHHKRAWERASGLVEYVLRTSLTGAFGGNSDSLLDALVNKIRERRAFDLREVFGVIRSQQRSLELTTEKLWAIGCSSDAIHLLFNLWYREVDHAPAFANNLAQIDHIFPQSQLKRIKVENPQTGRMDLQKYRKRARDQLANCMLLTREEHGAGGKGAMTPDEWFARADNDAAYRRRHCIPDDPELWKVENFERFIVARKRLILEKLGDVVSAAEQ